MKIFFSILLLLLIGCGQSDESSQTAANITSGPALEVTPGQVPVKGMITMVDLGADKCVPCKMMAPILEELKKEYRGRVAIIFLDVWKDSSPAKRFGIRAIPTQIFFDLHGKEVFRHIGFMSKEAIVAQLKALGVE